LTVNNFYGTEISLKVKDNMIVLYLPFPISVNALYAGKGRRYKSKLYVAWEIEARQTLRSQKWTPMAAVPLQITYRFGQPDNRRRDLANLEKCCSDLLVHESIIKDDSLIHRMVLEWGELDGAEVEIVTLQEANKAPSSQPTQGQS